MFRGKESSNRFELSQLVQDLLNLVFWAPCGSGEGTGGWETSGASGGIGVSHLHVHAHTCMHACTCIAIVNGCRHGGIHV